MFNCSGFRNLFSQLFVLKKFYCFAGFVLIGLTPCAAQLKLANLLTENLSAPLGIGTQRPRFSWQLVSAKRGVKQTAYEMELIASGKKLWSSGKVASESSLWNEYGGDNLQSNTKYEWRVRVTDNRNETSDWAGSSFQTALLHPSDWKAKWITSGLKGDTVNGLVPMLRKTFTAGKKIRSATAFISSHGLYEAWINGQRIGDACLSPGWTSYKTHLQYQTYDVTYLLLTGKNAIGALLGSGWYRTRLSWNNTKNIYGAETALLFQLAMSYEDGTTETIVSDGSWTASSSDVLSSEIYDGEVQDARKRQGNWTAASFIENGWQPVLEKDAAKDNLVAAINEPIKKHEALKPVKILTSPKGETILDFGQNLVGWVSLHMQGKAGTKITLSHFEMLDKTGNPYFANLRSAKAQAAYTLSGKGDEFFEPHFTFFGFRYVKVQGLTAAQLTGDHPAAAFTATALYSDMKPTGSFECSNTLVNRLQHNIQWGQRGNFLDVPTDCPQRDERLGWTGDAEVFSRTAAYNFNVNRFFAKWLKDVAADQYPNGAIPFVIPDVLRRPGEGGTGAAGWSDAGIIIPYNMYVVYGDKKVLEDQYSSMKAYLNYMQSSAKNDLWNTGFQFGDWLSYRVDDSKGMIGMKSAVTDNYLVAQCFYAYNAELMRKTANVLQKPDEAKEYAGLLQRVRQAFQKEYMTASGRLVSETQTAYVLALQFDLLPEAVRPEAADRLAANIASYNYHLTTGFLGTPFLAAVLTRFGKTDVAYKLLLQDTYPSWLYPIKAHGATTIWERWDSMKADSTFQDPGMTSFNHYAYGAIGDWMYRTIAGIDSREAEGAGYKSIIIKPRPGGDLTYAAGSLQTGYGWLSSAWKKENEQLILDVEIPANTSATIYLPATNSEKITDGGKSLASLPDAKIIGQQDGCVMIETGSGKYHFTISK